MPLKMNRPERNTIVVNYIGILDFTEHRTNYRDIILPACEEVAPDILHCIHNVTELDMSFADMITWLESMQTRRTQHLLAPNMKQYFVGGNKWTESISNWMKKHDDTPVLMFGTLEKAVSYIER